MNKATIAASGAFGASVLSALTASCCFTPALLLAFGFSTTIATPLTDLEPYRPSFIAVGVLCLAAAGWWLYRKPTGCATGACVPPTQRGTRVFFWFSAAGFITATFYPYLVAS
jgi:MerT mercuric transport protein